MVVGLDKFVEKAGVRLEGMPFTKNNLPDEVPYTVLPKEERGRYLEFAQTLCRRIATKVAEVGQWAPRLPPRRPIGYRSGSR